MTLSAPPRPPRPSDPVTHGEFEALVEALIEEARQRQRRRRRRYAAVVTLVSLSGVALFAVLGRSAQSHTASPAVSHRSSIPAAAASSRIAFIKEPPGGGYCGVVYVMNPDGSGQRRLAELDSPRVVEARIRTGCGQETAPAWSPDGRRIAIVSYTQLGVIRTDIFLMNADGSGERRLSRSTHTKASPAWSPDGRQIAFTTLRHGTVHLAVVKTDGSGQRLLARNLAGNLAPAWSPDGRRIAFVSRRNGGRAISVVNVDGSGQRTLAAATGRGFVPVWSPAGREIAFVRDWQVWVMNADGSGQRRLTHNGARNVAPSWSPDGRSIAFERRIGRGKDRNCSGCGRASSFQVWVMNADGSEARKLAQDAAQPVWSPDARRIAFVKHPYRSPLDVKRSDIYVMNADGTAQRNLTRDAGGRESQPVWSPPLK